MGSINTMLLIDIVIVVFGLYLFFLALKMKKQKKVEKFIIAEELLKNCKAEEELAGILSLHSLILSVTMIICGGVMIIHESVFNIGYWYYLVVGILAVAFLFFYMKLTNARIKYC